MRFYEKTRVFQFCLIPSENAGGLTPSYLQVPTGTFDSTVRRRAGYIIYGFTFLQYLNKRLRLPI
jgi:hypothetical protein